MCQLINLCFHGIGAPRRMLEPDEDHYWITVDFFLRVLDEVAGRSDVKISFDDGNESDADIAVPALRERGLTAQFFPLAGRLTRTGSLNREHLRSLRAEGMAIGSHGMHHVSWRQLSPEDRYVELIAARNALVEASEGPINEAALPLGRYDRSVLGALRRLGYEKAFSSDRARAWSEAWLQPRYSVKSEDTVDTVRTILARPSARELLTSRTRIFIKRFR
jgi:peptidoglycan/xylan/chitin deacetylase (PgdA/CDA1 family)